MLLYVIILLRCVCTPTTWSLTTRARAHAHTRNTHTYTRTHAQLARPVPHKPGRNLSHRLRIFSIHTLTLSHSLTSPLTYSYRWHGSRLTNWVGILSQGLRIAPPEAPKTGYRFGKGGKCGWMGGGCGAYVSVYTFVVCACVCRYTYHYTHLPYELNTYATISHTQCILLTVSPSLGITAARATLNLLLWCCWLRSRLVT